MRTEHADHATRGNVVRMCDIRPEYPRVAAADARLALLADDRRAFRHQAIMDDVAVRERKAKAMRARAKLAG